MNGGAVNTSGLIMNDDGVGRARQCFLIPTIHWLVLKYKIMTKTIPDLMVFVHKMICQTLERMGST